MKAIVKFVCDICGSPKNPESRSWYLARSHAPLGLRVFSWDEDEAGIEGVRHLCGQRCLQREIASFADAIGDMATLEKLLR